MHLRYPVVLLLSVIIAPARADLPLTVEDLITDRGKIRLDAALTYANTSRHSVSTGQPIIVQTGAASFVILPTLIGESIENSDVLAVKAGLRYGLTARTELYTRVTGLSSWQRSRGVSGSTRSSTTHLADAWAGMNYQLKYETATPALSGFAELAVTEQQRYRHTSFKSAMLGFTTYKAIDPVVFSLTGAYGVSLPRRDGDDDYRPGNLLLLNPSVAFAVNDRVTLSGGVQWTWRGAVQRSTQPDAIDQTGTDLLLSVGYGVARGNILNTTFKFNASGNSGAQLWAGWLYTF